MTAKPAGVPGHHAHGAADNPAPAEPGDCGEPSQSGSRSGSVEVTVTYDASGVPHKAGSGKLYLMRDSKNPDGPVLAFTEAEWEAFILGVKDGEFDLPEDQAE